MSRVDAHFIVLSVSLQVSAIKNLESLILKTGAKSTVQKSTIGDTPLVDGNTVDTDALPSRRSLDADLKRVDDKDTEVVKASLEKDSNLIEELHRIQGMLGTVMTKRKEKLTTSANGKKPTPMDEEVEKLRIQLQEQEITTTMRKADSSFLQAQLAEKDKCVDLPIIIFRIYMYFFVSTLALTSLFLFTESSMKYGSSLMP